jgi:hypothetical protein
MEKLIYCAPLVEVVTFQLEGDICGSKKFNQLSDYAVDEFDFSDYFE